MRTDGRLFGGVLAGTVPAYATAPALLYVACLMTRSLTEVAWDDLTEAAPAVITALAMPFTFSIAEGIAFGFISYVAIKLVTGRWRDIHPAVGILGSGVVMSWAYSLIRDTSGILLDRTPASSDLPEEIRRAVESDGDSIVTDLHVWQVGVGKFAAIICIVAHEPKSSDQYRELLREHEELVHVTIETQHCREDHETLR